MADLNPLSTIPENHPFQINHLPGPKGAYEKFFIKSGCFIRVDMPGVPKNGVKIFKKSDTNMVTFNGAAPSNELFPFDDNERVYAGLVLLDQDPIKVDVDVIAENGTFYFVFPFCDATLFLLPGAKSAQAQPSSSESPNTEKDTVEVESEKGEDSSSRKSIETVQESSIPEKVEGSSGKCLETDEGPSKSDDSGKPIETTVEGSSKFDQKGEDSSCAKSIETAEGSSKSDQKGKSIDVAEAKSEQDEGSAGKSTKTDEWLEVFKQGDDGSSPKSKKGSLYSRKSSKKAKGSKKSKKGKGSSSGKPRKVVKGSEKSKQGEDSSFEESIVAEGKELNKEAHDEGLESNKSSSHEAAEAWMLSCIKKNVLQIDETGQSTDNQTATEHAPHNEPEIEIGSVEECALHHPDCKCNRCDSNGICLKSWSTTEDKFPNINKLKIKGPDGVLEKILMENENGEYSLYVRADLPGLEEELCSVTLRDQCILVFGKPQARQRYENGARNYLVFLQITCTCFMFDDVYEDYQDGVLRLLCQIRPTKPNPPDVAEVSLETPAT